MASYLNLLVSILILSSSFQRIQCTNDTRSDITNQSNGNYPLSASEHKSLLIAAGCFWCAEQAFEQYAPGVIEVVSGYAGSDGIDSPTYRNHPGHYEVVLIEYDPNRTSYELLLQYAWRNIDPFSAYGQFCDRGFSYQPALFYADEEERVIAEQVRKDVLELYPEWDSEDVVVPILERPYFWMAEDYHQDYYIKNPWNYGYYKERCGRTKRLKEVWGEEQYYCYHDLELSCFNHTAVNEDGLVVEAVVNVKDVAEESEKARGLPTQGIIIVAVAGVVFACLLCVPVLRFIKPSCKREKKIVDEENVSEHNAGPDPNE